MPFTWEEILAKRKKRRNPSFAVPPFSEIEQYIKMFRSRLSLEHVPFNLFLEALTTRGYLSLPKESRHPVGSNDRLAYLGDAVLETIVREELVRTHGHLALSAITETVQSLVSRECCGRIAEFLDIKTFILHPYRFVGRDAVAEAFEALVAAVHSGCGYGAAKEFVLRCYRDSGIWPIPADEPMLAAVPGNTH